MSVAADFAAAAMGSQTGVSLYAPSTGASLTNFRGTDGIASVLASDKVLIYNQRAYSTPTRMTEQAVQDYIKYRTDYKEVIRQWMDDNKVDAVVYAGFISDVYNNDAAASQLSSDRGTGVLTLLSDCLL
ncbi:hypothetical protein M2105_002743 [Paenibacillus sp. PastF-1]|uniref:hypothetical protein n=1 Tax=unclassified Paenibacillus TaxID=185978 RepID=UPI00247DC9D7|nr:hypothetical protein [Paenibacillus sp. PastF-1]MDH6507586.1 hypothetical protein [Paenibacillus sp. PastM-3]